ncbi:hypothetical protein FALCPG4_017008 [Fusarium falciforme]
MGKRSTKNETTLTTIHPPTPLIIQSITSHQLENQPNNPPTTPPTAPPIAAHTQLPPTKNPAVAPIAASTTAPPKFQASLFRCLCVLGFLVFSWFAFCAHKVVLLSLGQDLIPLETVVPLEALFSLQQALASP